VREHREELVLGAVHALGGGPSGTLLVQHASTLGLDTPPLRGVAEDEDRPDDGTIRREDRCRAGVDGPHTIISAREGRMVDEPDCRPVGHRAICRALDRFPRALVDDDEDIRQRSAGRGISAPARE